MPFWLVSSLMLCAFLLLSYFLSAILLFVFESSLSLLMYCMHVSDSPWSFFPAVGMLLVFLACPWQLWIKYCKLSSPGLPLNFCSCILLAHTSLFPLACLAEPKKSRTLKCTVSTLSGFSQALSSCSVLIRNCPAQQPASQLCLGNWKTQWCNLL